MGVGVVMEKYKVVMWVICRWVLELQCGGSRNLLSALRMTMENDEEQKHHICELLLQFSPPKAWGTCFEQYL